MGERLPYEEQLAQKWNELPLPDEDMAWEDMKHRLDEDDDRVLPFWLRGCAIWAIPLIFLTGLCWWMIRHEKWFIGQKPGDGNELVNKNIRSEKITNDSIGKPLLQNDSLRPMDEIRQTRNAIVKTSGESIPNENGGQVSLRKAGSGFFTKNKNVADSISRKKRFIKKPSSRIPGIKESSIMQREEGKTDKGVMVKENHLPNERKYDSINSDTQTVRIYNLLPKQEHPDLAKRNIDGKDKPNSIKKQNKNLESVQSDKKNKQLKDKGISFAAGLSLVQQLPINGQNFVPYNSEGRKGSLADYIPALYLRIYRQNKWFIQTEFRYGAPQLTKELLFNQKIITDTFQNTTTTTSTRLKKTFYHQLPLSFHYRVIPGWSVGAGLIWNKFSSALSEQDVIQRNNSTTVDSVISKGLFLRSTGSDSNFVSSHFQAVFETQYSLKRFSIGIRYAFGLEPYIKFKLPGGIEQQETNSSLNLFIRYELWRSKRK